MKKVVLKVLIGGVLIAGMNSCEVFRGPDKTGKIELSSQLFGTDSYYLFGFQFENADYYRFPYQGDPEPDIMNDGIRILQDGEVAVIPQFNTPPGENRGFAKIGEFGNLEEARSFYESYHTVGNDLQFEILSDTVELYQVFVQKTAAGNFVKMLVTDIRFDESESGSKYTEVVMDYTYQPNGSSTFPE
ncbi:MAG: hypothetical protein ACWGNV_05425 [Bacteroidales bacterium]